MRGKYSPTVTQAYMRNQEWFREYMKLSTEEYLSYDIDGYDSYGYNDKGYDRAGNHEDEYAMDDYDQDDNVIEGYNALYEQVLDSWSFDGTKPVRLGHD